MVMQYSKGRRMASEEYDTLGDKVCCLKKVKTQDNLKQKEGNKKQHAERECNGEINGGYKI